MTDARPVAIAARDGTMLRGQVWPGGNDWVILIHDVGEDDDLDRWWPLVPSLLAQGVSVLAMDLRGHGASDGIWNSALGADDLAAAVAHARGQGATFIAIGAAGASALDALLVASGCQLDALVLLSPLVEPDASVAIALRGTGEAKLFVVGAADPDRRRAADHLRNASIGWALTVSVPATEQGTDLLTGPWAGHLEEQVRHFVSECRFLAAQRGWRRDVAGRAGTASPPDER